MEAYRQFLLRKSEPHVKFIPRHQGTRALRVIEFGAGNSRLLVAMKLRQMLEEALGLEISNSLVAFAHRWVQDAGLTRVRPVPADVLDSTDFPQ